MPSPSENTTARAIRIAKVRTSELHPNPHNPRLLFDETDMGPLRESIRRVKILVPLTVYREKKTGKYVILDGQRRWMCAQDVGLETVPVNEVEEPTLVQNIVTMFQIHKLRRDWELMPTALKLELLMAEVNDKSETRMAALTGVDKATVSRCKKLLSYPRKYQDMMLFEDPALRVKSDFFIELHPVMHDKYIKKFDWFKPNPFIEGMLKKHKVRGLKSVTDFRVVKQQLNNAAKANRIGILGHRLEEFYNEPGLTVAHLSIESIKTSTTARRLTNSATALYDSVDALDTKQYYGETDLWNSLERLSELIRRKLRQLDRRLMS